MDFAEALFSQSGQRVGHDTASMTGMSVRVCLCRIHGVRMSAFMLHLSVVSSPSCYTSINNYGTHHRQRSKIIKPHYRDGGTWSQTFRTVIVCAINCDSWHVRGWMSWHFLQRFHFAHSPRVAIFGHTTFKIVRFLSKFDLNVRFGP
jgi:hypothetical protein